MFLIWVIRRLIRRYSPKLKEAEVRLKKEVAVGGTYDAKIRRTSTTVRITAATLDGGWDAENVQTGRSVHVRIANGELRGKETPREN